MRRALASSLPFALLALVALPVALAGCDNEGVVLVTPFRPPPPPDPALFQRDLGRTLFFEKALSGNRDTACASCHVIFTQGAEPLALSIGTGGTEVSVARRMGPGSMRIARNSQDFFLRASMRSLFWDGRVFFDESGAIHGPVMFPSGLQKLTEAQALLPLLDRAEMRGGPALPNELSSVPDGDAQTVWNLIMIRLMQIPAYRQLFALSFPDVPEGFHDITHLARAIVVFEEALWERRDSDFDLDPMGQNMTQDARAGLVLFFGDAGCSRCHSGETLSDGRFYNIGVPQIGPGTDPATGLDDGRMRVTMDPRDRFRFRTPPLRNVALTGPYMHDGAYDRLEDAVRHHLDPEAALRAYSVDSMPMSLAGEEHLLHAEPAVIDAVLATLDRDAVVPLRPLTGTEVVQLIAFLHTLSSHEELNVLPGDGVPASLPSGLPIDLVEPFHPSRVFELGF